MALIKRSEYGRDVTDRNEIIVGLRVVVVLVLVAIVIAINGNKGRVLNDKKANTYVMAACEELANEQCCIPDIKKIYISEEIAGGSSTIDYVYRVYIEYESELVTERVMYIVDDKDESYFITEYSSEQLVCNMEIAEYEIYGFESCFEPSDNWEELSASDVEKIENKIDWFYIPNI